MKIKDLNKIFFVFASLIIVAAGFPSAVKASCSCTCQPIVTTLTNPGSTTVVSKSDCKQATSDVTLPEQADLPACTAACKALPAPGGIGTPPCYNSAGGGTCSSGETASCWCDAGSGAYKKSATASQTDCQKICTDLNQKFVAWSNAGPVQAASANNIKCPTGGDWTDQTCLAAVNSDGAKIGRWNPPSGQTTGPYCFYNDIPIKLGVGLGTVTQANLAQYLAAAYNLALGIAAVLAVIFIMIGGFRYIAAAGGAEVDQGKSMIKNAVIGLVLAALSYTLLLTVNPDILSLRLPTIQLIKQCDIKPVDCGSISNSDDCGKADPALKCSWDNKASTCLSLASTQSGTPGQVGGDCKVDPTTGKGSCDLGDCVDIGGGVSKCSQFAKCQACQNDTTYDSSGGIATRVPQQCAASGSLPVKCISHMCADINSNNPPKPGSTPSNDNYIACTNATCSSDANCPANQKCNDNHVCIVANQGTTGCTTDGDCRTQDGQKCVKFTQSGYVVSTSSPLWKTACCANGDGTGCLGCNPISTYQGTDDNPDCPKLMKCDPGTSKCVAR